MNMFSQVLTPEEFKRGLTVNCRLQGGVDEHILSGTGFRFGAFQSPARCNSSLKQIFLTTQVLTPEEFKRGLNVASL